MSIIGLLLKNQLRGYRKLLRKGLPLVVALLVSVLLFADEVRLLVTNQDLLSVYLPLIYAAIFLFIAARRILFLKYPPFFFSLPGLFFFFTTPVNHRLVLSGKILLSYLPLLFLGLGWSLLAGQIQTSLPGWTGLFFCLVAITNLSWLLYNAATDRILLRKVLLFLVIVLLLALETPGLVWAIIAAGSFWRALSSIDELNWSKYENHCRLAYLSRKYLLDGSWDEMVALTYEYMQREPPVASFLAARVYVTGYKAFTYGQILIMSRYPLLFWVIFLSQYVISVIFMRKGEFLSLFGGSLFLLLGFVALFSPPVQKLRQKMAQGLFPVGGFHEFITGMLILPIVFALVLLTAIILIVPSGISPIWQIATAVFLAAFLSYLVVVKGLIQPVFSGWFVTGVILFGLLFSLVHSGFWREAIVVLLLFIPFGFFSWWRMKKIFEGVDVSEVKP